MKRSVGLLLAAISTAAAAGPGPAETVEAFHKALGGADQKAVLAYMAEDADVLEQGFVDASREEYRRNTLTADMAFAARTKREVQSQQSSSSGDLAFVETLSRTRGKFDKDNVDISDAETVILRKDGGDWKIIHIHRSGHTTRLRGDTSKSDKK